MENIVEILNSIESFITNTLPDFIKVAEYFINDYKYDIL
jgi:hypothetical protein